MIRAAAFACTTVLGLSLATSAFAQSSMTRTVRPDKPAKVAIVTALKVDCSIGEVGTLKILTGPKSGSLEVKGATRVTPSSFRCPNKQTPVQELFYKANASFSGTDEIAYETRTPEGATQTFTVKFNVSADRLAKAKDQKAI